MAKSVVFLFVWFMWSAGEGLSFLVRYQVRTEYYVYDMYGLSYVPIAIVFIVFILNLITLYALYDRLAIGIFSAFAGTGISAVYSVVTGLLMLQDIPGVREVYRIGREIRALPINENSLDLIFSEHGILYTLMVKLLFYALVVSYVRKNRHHFRGDEWVA